MRWHTSNLYWLLCTKRYGGGFGICRHSLEIGKPISLIAIIMRGYGSLNTSIFAILLAVSTTCLDHCWVGHRQVEDQLSERTVQNKVVQYISNVESSFYSSSGKMCSDGSHVDAIWNSVLVMTTSFIVSSVGVSTSGLVGRGRLRNLPCWWVGKNVCLSARVFLWAS
jgi:hypothetical protein